MQVQHKSRAQSSLYYQLGKISSLRIYHDLLHHSLLLLLSKMLLSICQRSLQSHVYLIVNGQDRGDIGITGDTNDFNDS